MSISWAAVHMKYHLKYFILHLFEVKLSSHINNPQVINKLVWIR